MYTYDTELTLSFPEVAKDYVKIYPQTQKLELQTKEIVSCESTAEEVSFEW